MTQRGAGRAVIILAFFRNFFFFWDLVTLAFYRWPRLAWPPTKIGVPRARSH